MALTMDDVARAKETTIAARRTRAVVDRVTYALTQVGGTHTLDHAKRYLIDRFVRERRLIEA